ncbi:MAG: bacteriohemerythrin [Methylobacter sp.]
MSNKQDLQLTEIFPWNENFATGIEKIDEQHRQLVHLANQLASHLSHKADLTTLNDVFKQLAEYAIYHFETEERVWHEYFPEDDWETEHKKTHESFLESVLSLKAEETTKPFDEVIEDILTFLTQWLAFHILDSDMRMAKVVLKMQSGASFEEAKGQAGQEMEGAMKVLIQTILKMYESLSARTLQLTREIHDRQLAESKLRLAGTAFDTTQDAVCIMDTNAVIIEANAAFSRGIPSSLKAVGANLKDLKSGFRNEPFLRVIWNTVHNEGHWSGEIFSLVETGEEEQEWLTLSAVKNQQGEITNYVGVFSNIRQLLKLQQSLQKIAHHDALTGLPNRLLLSERLQLGMANAKRSQSYLAICYLDLDGFKPINDNFGHAAGDQVLKEIARRLQTCIRSNDTVARLGGDEFVMLLVGLKAQQDFIKQLDRALKLIQQPLQFGNDIASVSASIGVTVFPLDDSNADVLIEHADQAMYEAKRLGKSRHYLFDPSVNGSSGDSPSTSIQSFNYY